MFFLDHAWLVPLIPAVSFVVIAVALTSIAVIQRRRARRQRDRTPGPLGDA